MKEDNKGTSNSEKSIESLDRRLEKWAGMTGGGFREVVADDSRNDCNYW